MNWVIPDKEIEAIRKEIETLRKKIEEKKAILNFLESKRQKKPTTITSDASSERLDVSSLMADVEKQKPTIINEVRRVINEYFEDKEFTAAHVIGALSKLNLIPPDNKSIRQRVSSILITLHEKEEIERTYEGSGNVPHRYRRMKNFSDDAENERLAGASTSASLLN